MHSGRIWSASDLQDNTWLYDRTLGITVSGGIDHGGTDDSGEPLLRAVIAVLAAWLRNHYMVGMGALSKDSKVVLTLLRFKRNPLQKLLIATTHLARIELHSARTLPHAPCPFLLTSIDTQD